MTSPYTSSPAWRVLWLLGVALALCWVLAPFLWSIRNSIMLLEDTYKPLFIPFLQFMPTLQTWRFELIEPEHDRAVRAADLARRQPELDRRIGRFT